MRTPGKKMILLSILLISITFVCGCTNWEKKYNALNVQYQNTLGLLAYEKAQSKQIADSEKMIVGPLQQVAGKYSKGQ